MRRQQTSLGGRQKVVSPLQRQGVAESGVLALPKHQRSETARGQQWLQALQREATPAHCTAGTPRSQSPQILTVEAPAPAQEKAVESPAASGQRNESAGMTLRKHRCETQLVGKVARAGSLGTSWPPYNSLGWLCRMQAMVSILPPWAPVSHAMPEPQRRVVIRVGRIALEVIGVPIMCQTAPYAPPPPPPSHTHAQKCFFPNLATSHCFI